MKHTLSINNNQLSYIKGKVSRKKIKIYKDEKIEIKQGIINNGVISDINEFILLLRDFSNKHFKKSKINLVIDSTHNILFREISVPIARKKELKEMVKNEIISSIGDIGDYLLDFIILNKEDKKYNILVFIINKQIINDYVNALAEARINCKSIDISSNCIAKLFGFIEKSEQTFLILDIRPEYLNLYLIDQECCVWSKNIKLSLINFRKNNILNIAFEEISDHINRTLQFQKTRNKHSEIKKIFILGSTFQLPELLRTIENNTGLSCVNFTSKNLIEGKNNFINVKDYTDAIGALIERR